MWDAGTRKGQEGMELLIVALLPHHLIFVMLRGVGLIRIGGLGKTRVENCLSVAAEGFPSVDVCICFADVICSIIVNLLTLDHI